ncbi:MAG: hypothetical protein WHV63_04830 [Ignavibacteria bacterium]
MNTLQKKSDGNFYLAPGKYTVEIFDGKEKVSVILEIAERKEDE